MTDHRGAALIDLVAATALTVVLAAIAVPVAGGTLDRERAIMGAQYLAGQLQRARLESLRRGQSVAVHVRISGDRAACQLFVDGNGNGVLQRDIDRGVDPALAPETWLDEQARAITLRINQSIADVSGSTTLRAGDDPVRIGSTALVSFSPQGGATSGTLYVAGTQGPQLAVRIFGATGRVRTLIFDASTRLWHP